MVLGFAALLSYQAAHVARAEAAQRKPNIVIILTDDQGWGDLSMHGNTNIRTPNIDSLAQAGVRFDRFYVSPVCSPTRASLLTGRYHPRSGIHGTSRGQERMDPSEVTLGDVFKAAGYATACFGKWHNGSQVPYHPNARGFDEFYGFCCGHWSNYFDTTLEHNGKVVQTQGYINDVLTDKAIEYIAAKKGRPFLCYLAYNTPHSPFQVPDKYWNRLANRKITMRNRDPEKEELPKTRAALAMCENLDWNVGRITKQLTDLGLADNTIVVYFSDNGPNSWRWNDGMAGRKGSVQEGGVRVPFLIRWPGHIVAKGTIPQIASHIDILPTLADLAGVSTAKCKPLDGVSLRPLLEGRANDWPDRMIFSSWRRRVTVRTQRYRADHKTLYDMVRDPGQRKNIAREKPEVHKRLVMAIRKWRDEVFAERWPRPPYPVAFDGTKTTVLPAQECIFRGKGLRFSSRHPNCSWVTNWASTDQYVYWDVNVATAGRYEVTLLYTCPADSVGTEIEVDFDGRKLRAKIVDAYDPPLIDSPDRVERTESYEKPFKPLVLGTVEWPKAKGKLSVRAVRAPGKQVMDLRAVVLRLQ